MQTITIDSVTCAAPEGYNFAFGLIPIICEWSSNNVAYIRVTVSDSDGNSYVDDRTPIYRNGQYMCIFDISPYVRAMLGDPQPFETSTYTNLTENMGYVIDVYYNDSTSTSSGGYSFVGVWGAITTSEVFNADTIVHYWPNYPFIISAFVSATAGYPATITYTTDDATGSITKTQRGITYLPITYQGNVANTIVITSHFALKMALDPDSGVVADPDNPNEKTITVIKHTGNCSGLYLRWVDPQGLARFWVFKEGKYTYRVANESTSLRNEIDYGAINNYNGTGITIENKTAYNLKTLGYVNATADDIKILKTLLSSPIVEAYINGYYVRVTVATSSVSFSQAQYQTFECTIILPQEETQRL